MKQSYLNIGLVIFGVIVLIFATSAIFGKSPLSILYFMGNLFVYLFFTFGFYVTLPVILGAVIRYFGIPYLDTLFGEDRDETVPTWIHILLAIALALIIGYFWMRLTPIFAFIPSLSLWPPIEFLRWSASWERINVLLAIWPALATIFGYIGGTIKFEEDNY